MMDELITPIIVAGIIGVVVKALHSLHGLLVKMRDEAANRGETVKAELFDSMVGVLIGLEESMDGKPGPEVAAAAVSAAMNLARSKVEGGDAIVKKVLKGFDITAAEHMVHAAMPVMRSHTKRDKNNKLSLNLNAGVDGNARANASAMLSIARSW